MKRLGFPQILFAPEGEGAAGGVSSSSTAGSGESSTGSVEAGSSSSPSGAPSSATPGAASSSTAPSPSPEATVAPGVASPPVDDGFEDILQQLSGVEPPAPAAPAPQTTVASPQVAPQTPLAAPAAEAQPVVPPPAQPAAPSPGPQEVSPPLTPAEPGKFAASLRANTQALAQSLADTEFKLSPEDVEALGIDPTAGPAISQIMARSALSAVAMSMSLLEQALGPAVQKMLTSRDTSREIMEQFYAGNKMLDKTKHNEAVLRFARLYRQGNPQASREQMIKDVGLLVAQSLGIPLTAAPQAPTPAKPGNGAAKPGVFVPAMSGPPGVPQPTDGMEDWSILGQDG